MCNWKKRMAAALALILTLCLTVPLPAMALDPAQLEEQGFIVEGDVLVVYLGTESHVVVPDGVVEIGDGAFSDTGEFVTSVTLPESVTSIGEKAFYNCSNLTSVVIPDSVQTIGESAFEGCSSLTEVTMPQELFDSNLDRFYGTPWLEANQSQTGIEAGEDFVVEGYRLSKYQGAGGDVVIPDGVLVIGEKAFRDCESLTSVTIPDSVTTIESSAFANCIRLTQVTIPDSVTEIQYQAFYYCVSLAQLELSANLENIGSFAFEGCRSLTDITIPSGSVDKTAFKDCEGLTRVTLGDGVTEIGELAFKGCGNLTQMTFGHGLERIDDQALSYSALSTIVLYDGLTSIDDRAFPSTLRDLAIPASVSEIDKDALFYCPSVTLHVVEGSDGESYAIRNNLSYENDYEEFVKAAENGAQDVQEDTSSQPQPVAQEAQEDSSFSPMVVILVIVVVAAAAGGGYVVMKKKKG